MSELYFLFYRMYMYMNSCLNFLIVIIFFPKKVLTCLFWVVGFNMVSIFDIFCRWIQYGLYFLH